MTRKPKYPSVKQRTKAVEFLRKAAPVIAKRLAPVYETLGWEWSSRNGAYHVPTEREVLDAINNLIADLLNPNSINVASGGIKVWLDMDEGYCRAGIEFAYDIMSHDVEDEAGSNVEIEEQMALSVVEHFEQD